MKSFMYFLNGLAIVLAILVKIFGGVDAGKGMMIFIMSLAAIGIAFGVLFVRSLSPNYKMILSIDIGITIVVYIFVVIYALSIPDLTHKMKLSLGLEQEEVLDTVITIYEHGNNYKVDFDYMTNNFTVYKNNHDGTTTTYMLSIAECDRSKSADVLNNYHGKINIGKANVVALYGQFNAKDEGESVATPYLVLDSGVYAIEGNPLVIEEVFTMCFRENNIFSVKLLEIDGLVVNPETSNKTSAVIESYYTDPSYKYIWNGRRLYKDLYVCMNYNQLTTQEKMKDYIEYLGLQKDKQVDKIYGKEIIVDSDLVRKIRLYYYNNMDSLNFMEIIFKDKKDSIIIKESDPKFKYDYITKLY